MIRDVAIAAYAKGPHGDVETLRDVIEKALGQASLRREEVGFYCSGSSDFLAGLPFSFVHAIDAIGGATPVIESHVEMDGAFALFEAWLRLQHGDIDSAVVYAYGEATSGSEPEVLGMQLDPYLLAPLRVDANSLAALQARALLDQSIDAYPESFDGCAAIVLVAGDRIRKNPVIRGIDHRIETHVLGARNLAESVSARLAAEHAGVFSKTFDLAVLHARYMHEDLILRDALKLDASIRVRSPERSPLMVGGLMCIGEAAMALASGESRRAVAHATAGPCLQQNLVCVMEAV